MPKKSNNRDEFNSKVIEIVAKRASYICSNPDCCANTIAPSDSDPNKIQYIGIVSHITAASPGGSRYDPSLNPEERKSISNAIFLCSSCATMIDKNNGIDYSADVLREWKNKHEDWIKDNLNKSINSLKELNVIENTDIIIDAKNGEEATGIEEYHPTQISNVKLQMKTKGIRKTTGIKTNHLEIIYCKECGKPNILIGAGNVNSCKYCGFSIN